MHATKEFDDTEPTIDTLGSVTLTTSAEHVQIGNSQLRTLDVRDCPDLHTLDLTGCQPGLHITVTTSPALRVLMLPDEAPGAIIHVDGGSHAPQLAVRGPVDELDACWEGGQFRLASQGRPHWWNASVNDADRTDTEAVIWSAPYRELGSALASMDRLRELRLINVSVPDRLELDRHERLESLVVDTCDGAQTLQVPEATHSLDVNRHPQLERIDGGGHVLRLRQCETTELTITGSWWQLLVDGGRLSRIHAEAVESVALMRVPLTADLTVREGTFLQSAGPIAPTIHANGLSNTPHAVTRLQGLGNGIGFMLRTLEDPSRQSWRALTTLLTRPAKRIEWLHRLRALEANIGTAHPEHLWQLRCLMHAAQQTRKPRELTIEEAINEAGSNWNWRFPADDAQRGYAADLHLAEVAADQPAAASFFALLDRVHDERHLGALADRVYQVRRRGHTPPEAFTTALSRGIARACRKLPKRRRKVAATTVYGLVRGAVLIRDADAAQTLRAFTNAHVDPEHRVRILRTLSENGCAAARTDLWVLATQLRPGREREAAQRAALAPVRSQALAPDNQETAHE